MKESSIILTFLKKIIRKIYNFFRKPLNRELLIFLIFLLVSCFFWVLQSLQEVRDFDMEIPVEYTEIPANISITNTLPATIRVSLRDKGTNLYYTYRHRKDLSIRINLMDWYRKDGIATIPASTFESSLRNRLLSSVQLLRIKPDVISVYFVEKSVKEVPIHLNSRITLSSQHILSDIPVMQPSQIKVYAPANVLDKLDQIETEMLVLDDLNDRTTTIVKLKKIDGVRFDTYAVQVTLNVEAFTEKSLVLPVSGLNFPTGEELLSFPPTVKVTFFVGLSSYKKISEKDFTLAVDYNSLIRSEKKSQKVALVKSPINISNIRIEPENVDCLIEKNR